MKALLLVEPGHLEIAQVADPEPGPHDVVVAVRACGICGSDIHGLDGSTGRRRPPLVMGHEAAGVVHQVGSAVAQYRPGDRVTFDSTVYCGRCAACRAGRINLCHDRRVLGVSCDEYRRDGAMAEFVAVPERIIYPLPESVSFDEAALVEPLSVALHAVRRLRLELGATALVVGAGVIGLLVVQLLRQAGCGRVFAADLDEARLELAGRFGAIPIHTSNDTDPAEVLAEVRCERGADVVVEAVGLDPTVRLAIDCVAKGGQVALVGNLAPEVTLPLQHAVTRELTFLGSCASAGEYPRCLELIAGGQIHLAPLIGGHGSLEEGPAWFERLSRGGSGLLKVLLQP